MQRSGGLPPPRSGAGRTGAHPVGIQLTCPHCGLTITARADWLASEHCPRCLARRHAAVGMLASTVPAAELVAAPDDPRDGGRVM